MFWVFWLFTRYQDLTVQSSHFKGILVILEFFFRVILVILEPLGYFGQLRGFRGVFFLGDILWFWGYFGDFGSIMVILVISRAKFKKKKQIYFTRKNFQNIKKQINTPKRQKEPM